MPGLAIIRTLSGISTALGAILTLAYFYYLLVRQQGFRSLREIVAGQHDPRLTEKTLLKVLSQFPDPKSKLIALEKLLDAKREEDRRPEEILLQAEANPAILQLVKMSNNHVLALVILPGIIFIVLGVTGLTIPTKSQEKTRNEGDQNAHEMVSPAAQTNTPSTPAPDTKPNRSKPRQPGHPITSPTTVAELEKLLQENNMASAMNLCSKIPESAEPGLKARCTQIAHTDGNVDKPRAKGDSP